MPSYIVNSLAFGFAASLFVTYEMGGLSAADAAFGAILLMTSYTGYQLAVREGNTFYGAFKAMLTEPTSYPRRSAYLSYVVSVSLGLMVFAQALVLTA